MSGGILFWGRRSATTGYLSNFYPTRFQDTEGVVYNSTEQYFMKKKQEMFDPTNTRLAKAIIQSASPFAIKKLGRAVRNFNEAEWNVVRYRIMSTGLTLKFTQNEDLRARLLATGDNQLFEASPQDFDWGIGLAAEEARHLPNQAGRVRTYSAAP